MIEKLRLLKQPEHQEQVFLITVFVMSIIVSFMFGYLVFRYERIFICKTPVMAVYQ
jgi:Ca2+-dependent lipid-binding protein